MAMPFYVAERNKYTKQSGVLRAVNSEPTTNIYIREKMMDEDDGRRCGAKMRDEDVERWR